MNQLDTIEQYLKEQLQVRSPITRRHSILNVMGQLKSQDIHCSSCSGICCTSIANSMQVTPLETFEIFQYLQTLSALQQDEFYRKCDETIKQYRLNVETYTGKKNSSALRRTYTCPFYQAGPTGCTLPKEFNPYGCLAFNPKKPHAIGEECSSLTELLTSREEIFAKEENEANFYLSEKLHLNWKKKDIPSALIEFKKIFESLKP